MKETIKYTFREEYIPPHCRKPRFRDVDGSIDITLKEITADEAPIALIVTNYTTRNGEWGVNDTPYRWHNKKLYKQYRHISGSETGNLYTIDYVIYEIGREGSGYPCNADEKTRIKNIKQQAKKYLFIDDEIWIESGEPRYVIHTFGLGHNHGGSSFSVTEYYNSNIGKNNYFNALQRKEAVEYFEKIALGRGDDKSVHEEYVDNIKILIPEAIKCNSKKEHGDGDSFMNSLESMINGSKTATEAGLFTMALGFKEIAKLGSNKKKR